MAELVVMDFDGVDTAGTVLEKLRELRKEHLIDLLDACIVVHPENGKVEIRQSVNQTALGASQGLASGAMVGALAGLLLLNPLAGLTLGGVAGAMMGALAGRLSDYGINDDFIKEVGRTIKPGTSALFVLVAKATTDKVVAEIKGFEPRIVKTSLSQQQEDDLRKALASATA